MPRNRVNYWKHRIWAHLCSKRIKRLSDGFYVIFTFDTEEDYNNKNYTYYNSYKYITSGVFQRLVDGLDKKGISATFYVTYNLARDLPEVLKYLENKNQTLGLHLHPHTLKNVTYPYSDFGKNADKITSYGFAKKMEWMQLTKDLIQSIVEHDVLLYRSGRLACDNETEKAAKLTGFKAISNHRGVYYMKPFSIWNLGVGMEDLLDFNRFDELSKYIIHFKERAKREQIIVFSAHPMLLYNHATDEIREKELNTFFEFVDYLKNDENVEIINQYQLLRMVEEWRGAK